MRRLPAAHTGSSYAASSCVVTSCAAPPSVALAAKTRPRPTNAIFLPSGESPSDVKRFACVTWRCVSTAGRPRGTIASWRVAPLSTSYVQIFIARSNAISLPSREIVGHSTRPPLSDVSCRKRPSAPCAHSSSLPLRSEAKYSVRPSGAHIGHRFFAAPDTTVSNWRVAGCATTISRLVHVAVAAPRPVDEAVAHERDRGTVGDGAGAVCIT